MNTKLSDKKVAEFMQKQNKMKRKVQTYSGIFEATPDKIFPLLCPSRELDWIPGWDCELIYTSDGYAEAGCVFTTDESNFIGKAVWVFTGFEPNSMVNIVRFLGDGVNNLNISLEDNNDGTTTAKWEITTTALNDEGNKFVENMPDQLPLFDEILKSMDHYLKTGKLLK